MIYQGHEGRKPPPSRGGQLDSKDLNHRCTRDGNLLETDSTSLPASTHLTSLDARILVAGPALAADAIP